MTPDESFRVILFFPFFPFQKRSAADARSCRSRALPSPYDLLAASLAAI